MNTNRNRYKSEWEKQFGGQTSQIPKTEPENSTVQIPIEANTLLNQFQSNFQKFSDLSVGEYPQINVKIYYFNYFIDKALFEQFLNEIRSKSNEEIHIFLKQSALKSFSNVDEIEKSILSGNGILFIDDTTYEIPLSHGENRSISASETETVILGSHDAFVESIDVNLSLIRRRVLSSKLKSVKLEIGETSKNTVYLLYIEDLVDESDLAEIKKRVQTVKNDGIADTNMLVQYIDDNPNSLFPQFYTSERPDIIVYKLFEGKIIGLLDNSPFAFCTPTSFFDFMETIDDFGQRWMVSTFIRALRYSAILITLLFTALYVGITTYHYEMIPQSLLPTLLESRSKVPFPPVLEALFLEFLLELLREAGARLPTKVGQTIGIVGGIVIGQAAVDAGITSNILIIVVASSAISSFVVPSYLMSTSIRIVRFGFIVIAGFWGNIGLIFGIGLLIIHLTGLTNLRAPYMLPLSPFHPKFFKYTFIRGPFKKKQ